MVKSKRGVEVTLAVLFIAGCGGAAKQALPVSADVPNPSSSTTTLGAPLVPSRLSAPATLNNGRWSLVPPRPTDSTPLTYAEAVGDIKSYTPDGTPTPPVLALARYTDTFDTSQPPPSIAGITGPTGWAPVAHDKLVLLLMFYGPDRMGPIGGPGGGPPTAPPPTGIAAYRQSIWLLDPTTGKGLWGLSAPGQLPQVFTSPGRG